jgi:hypothetical protein
VVLSCMLRMAADFAQAPSQFLQPKSPHIHYQAACMRSAQPALRSAQVVVRSATCQCWQGCAVLCCRLQGKTCHHTQHAEVLTLLENPCALVVYYSKGYLPQQYLFTTYSLLSY